MPGRFIEVGKNWLLAFFWSMLVLTWRESGSIEKHNGFCPPSQNPLCFTGRRDCVTATCKTQWILTRWPESLVFFNGSWTRLLPTSILVFKPIFCVFFFKIRWMCGADRLVLVVNDECLSDSALRGDQLLAFFQISLHLSTEMADLQNVDYLSMFSAVLLLLLWWEY